MDERISQAQSEGMDAAELRVQLEQHHTASYGWALSCCSRTPDLAEDALQTADLAHSWRAGHDSAGPVE